MILFDTDVCVEILRGNKKVAKKRLGYPGTIAISFMTVAELFYGAENSGRPDENSIAVEKFLMTFASNCSHHDDFHDLGNQLLFRILQRKPAVFIQHLATIPNGKRRAILIELESPLHSDVGIQLLIAKVEKLKGHDRIRDDVLYALKQAELKI